MRFFEVLKRKKLLFLNIFLFLYIIINLLSGDRGLISYFDKNDIEKKLNMKKITLTNELINIENKNLLLSDNLNFDYVDILIREKFRYGHKDEILIKLND
tara:strand:- start:80 stop:379 length:300 start_codon:yes stop_codon:yes gene_type:complete